MGPVREGSWPLEVRVWCALQSCRLLANETLAQKKPLAGICAGGGRVTALSTGRRCIIGQFSIGGKAPSLTEWIQGSLLGGMLSL